MGASSPTPHLSMPAWLGTHSAKRTERRPTPRCVAALRDTGAFRLIHVPVTGSGASSSWNRSSGLVWTGSRLQSTSAGTSSKGKPTILPPLRGVDCGSKSWTDSMRAAGERWPSLARRCYAGRLRCFNGSARGLSASSSQTIMSADARSPERKHYPCWMRRISGLWQLEGITTSPMGSF